MKTFSELKAIVYLNLGTDANDSAAVSIVEEAINTAVIIAAAIFDPPELRAIGDLTASNGNGTVGLANLTNYLDIVDVYNSSNTTPMSFVPYELWRHIVPSNVGKTKFFTVFGSNMYVKDTPGANLALQVAHTKYPTRLANAADLMLFDFHDGYIISVATAIAWAAYEENESAALQRAVADAIAAPMSLSEYKRKLIQGALISFDEVALKGAKQ